MHSVFGVGERAAAAIAESQADHCRLIEYEEAIANGDGLGSFHSRYGQGNGVFGPGQVLVQFVSAGQVPQGADPELQVRLRQRPVHIRCLLHQRYRPRPVGGDEAFAKPYPGPGPVVVRPGEHLVGNLDGRFVIRHALLAGVIISVVAPQGIVHRRPETVATHAPVGPARKRVQDSPRRGHFVLFDERDAPFQGGLFGGGGLLGL